MKGSFPNPVMIFGAGLVGMEFLNTLESSGVPVIGFLDNFKPLDQPIAGKPVFRLQDYPNDLSPGDTPVLIGVRHKDISVEDIISDLRSAGWKKVIPTLGAFVREYREFVGDIFWKSAPGYYDDPAVIARTEKAKTIWADDKSRRVYEGLLAFRKTYDDTYLTPADMEDEYFPADIPSWNKKVRFVDGGAFTGDTLKELLKRGYEIEAAAEFEPDPANFSRLVDTIRFTASFEAPIFCWPCALSDRNTVLRFKSEAHRSMGSAVCAEGEIQVSSVTLDSVLHNFRPTLIKLDIEGAERQALAGAEEILRSCRPGCAICAYHLVDDLWEVPLWFSEKMEGFGYRYYLRAHNPGGTNDHCFYAVPE